MITSAVSPLFSASKLPENSATVPEKPSLAVQARAALVTCFSRTDNADALRLASLSRPERRAASARVSVGSGAVSLLADADGENGTFEIKSSIFRAVEGIDRGIFGASSEKKSEIEALVKMLESQNPIQDPTDHLSRVDGCWKLIYSTISILGSKRTKLGLRGFITLGDFLQKIDVAKGKAVNEIKFNVGGFAMLSGQLIVTASFRIASKTRVDISFENSSISPEELMNLFQKNHDLLLSIFNPDGWLEITYVDESMRIGRDDKGNIFILEKVT